MPAGDVFVRIGTDFKQFDAGMREVADRLGDVGKSASGLGATLGKALGGPLDGLLGGLGKLGTASLGIGALGTALGGVVGSLTGTISAASSVAEAQNKVNAVFGEGASAVTTFAETAAQSVGLSKGAALTAAGTFGNLFDQLKIGSGVSAEMSTRMLTLASDFGSFHDADISQVIDAQTAAFRGEYDALQRFVPTINAAAVEQQALAATGKASTKELTEQDKALAVYALMMQGAGQAAGDFARTSDSLANAQRSLGASFENLQTTIGEQLLPAVAPLVASFAKTLPGAIEAVKPLLQGLGATIAGVAATITPLVEGTIAAVQKLLGGDAEGAIGAVVAAWSGFWRIIQPVLTDVANRLVGWVGEQAPRLLARLGEWGRAFVDWVSPRIGPLLTEVGQLATRLWTWITDTAAPEVLKKLQTWGAQFTAWVEPLIPPFLAEVGTLATRLGTWITDEAAPAILKKLGEWGKQFSDWIGPATDTFLAEWPGNLTRFLDWIEKDAAPAIVRTLGTWIKAFSDWIGGEGDGGKAAGGMLTTLGNIAGALWTFISKTAEVLGPRLLKWAGLFLGWVATDVVPFLAEKLGQVLVKIGEWLRDTAIPWALEAMKQLGIAIVNGIVAGIKAAPGALADAIKSLIPTTISLPAPTASGPAAAPAQTGVVPGARPRFGEVVAGGPNAEGKYLYTSDGGRHAEWRDAGGPGIAGRSYLIGTPELFIPRTSGEFVPLNAMRGLGGAPAIDYDRLAQAMARVHLAVSVDDVHGALIRKGRRNAGLALP